MLLRIGVVLSLCVCAGSAQVGVTGSAGGGIGPGPQPGFPNQQAPMPAEAQGPPASIEGSVTNAATGEPLKRASIVLMPSQGGGNRSSYSTSTDASGQFAMKDIAPGSYRLTAERTGYVNTNFNARGGNARGGNARSSTMLTLAPGQEMKKVEIRMQPHAVIAGRVVDEDGEPLSGVQMQAMSMRYVQGRRQLLPSGGTATNDLGEYRIYGLPAGKYYVSATHQPSRMTMPGTLDRTANPNNTAADEGYAPTYYPGTHDASAAIVIPVTAGQPVGNIDMKLQRVRTVRVRGKVTGALGQGRTMVMLLPQNDGISMFGPRNMTGARQNNGTFELRGVTPGSYVLVAQHMEQGAQQVARIPLNVGNSNVDNVELTPVPGMQVSGQVKLDAPQGTDASQMLPQISFTLQARELSPFSGTANARVNADGSFTLQNVFPNKYRVMPMSFGAAQGLYVKSIRAGEQELPKGEIEIQGAPPQLTIVMGVSTAQISGQVKADKPEAAQGATVVLIPPQDKVDRQDLFRTETSDQYGKFSFQGVAPGEYTLYAWENVEPGAWGDPDFLKLFEGKGQKVSVKDNASATVEAALLNGEQGSN